MTGKGFGFSSEDRLRKKNDFKRLFSDGKVVFDKYLGIRYLSNSACRSRLGISIPKGTCKAHDRNRLKRFLREVFRLNKRRISPPVDISVLVKKKAFGLGFKGVERSFLMLLKKASLLER
jgi:ribonuclease P protein component